MLIAMCKSHGPPRGRIRKYDHSVRPVGFPNRAVLCRTTGCTEPALAWLDEESWQAYQNGERIFLAMPSGGVIKIGIE